MGWFKKRLAKHPMLNLIRDPKQAKAASAAIKAGQEASNIGYLSEKKMRKLIRGLAHDSGIFGIPARKLEAQGLHAEKIILEALNDPDFLQLKASSRHAFDGPPAETAIKLLGDCGSSQSLETLRYLMTVEQFAKNALAMFARLCDPNQLNELRPHLDQSNQSPLNSVCAAFQNRFFQTTNDDSSRTQIVEFLTEYILSSKKTINRSVIETIAEIDRDAASDFLLKPEFLFAESPNRYIVLNQIAQSNILLPAESATKLFAMKINAEESALVLQASAITLSNTLWEEKLQSLLDAVPSVSDNLNRSIITGTLTDAVAAKLGYESSYELFALDCDADEATPAQLHLCDLNAFQSEIDNGGFLQFFFNNTGTYWKQILKALHETNSPNVASLLKKAVDTIQLTESDTARDTIHAKLEKLTEDQEKILDELSTAFYKISTELNIQIIRYVLQHREELKKTALPKPK